MKFRGACYNFRRMSVFTIKVNSVTGKSEWELQNEDYDYHQEIARSAFADMLHDTERNQKYYLGVKLAIEKIHSMGKKAHVLDIGTGTGLLSLMAAKSGADTVVACEAFQPMAECARKIISDNGLEGKIRVIPKRSTDMTVGTDGDMEHRANVLVTEVFDTELIGEGAIATFRHAHEELLEKDCIVVPSSATVYVQVVGSQLAQNWNKLQPISDVDGSTVLLDTPVMIQQCSGAAAVHDIQLSQFPRDQFYSVIPPVPVFRFDWSGKVPLLKERSNVLDLVSSDDGVAQVVFMWWDLVMDLNGEVILSCAPVWAHPLTENGHVLPWRDHWMQAVYYLPKEIPVRKRDELVLVSHHDEYSFWFHLFNNNDWCGDQLYKRPVCDCGLHIAFGRTRIGAINDADRNYKYVSALREYVTSDSICLCLSDGSLLGPLAAQLGAKRVYCIDGNTLTRHVIQDYIKHNNLQDKVVVLSSVRDLVALVETHDKITLVFGEPHFVTTLLPWQNIYFWYLKNEVSQFLSPSAATLPVGATVWAMALQFSDLWKIRAPLHSVEGFKMTEFDKLIENSSSISDSPIEAQPLWEYHCEALTQPFCVMDFNFTKNIEDTVETEGKVNCEGCGTCHGIALWVDWDLDGNLKHAISTGPRQTVQINKKVAWDMHTRQGVYFFQTHKLVDTASNFYYKVQFRPLEGHVHFHFDIKPLLNKVFSSKI
ncbi:protein arginine N-methyltransferase 7 isoform X2 [Zootermopsis nevadensis]|uniref:protein arginine N-methyltransferase 7 isoform X2 n=1 Tax=Zootermopsis nevadensis TaxID=136037 RepID=UPI000B8E2BFD|nr:protein arginine N-methyltransferase 7 isoform X2 [Zootermopsis nevadensis]